MEDRGAAGDRLTVLGGWDAELAEQERRLQDELDRVREKRDAIRRLAQEGRPVLSGASLRVEARAWLVKNDPAQEGRHYQEITAALLESGEIPGKDRAANVRATLHQAGDLFTSLGRGQYTWRQDKQS